MIFSGQRQLSNDELKVRAARAATGFQELGIVFGDAVALLLRNDFAFLEAANAVAMLGAFSVPINWHFGADEVGHILRDSDAKVLVVHADLLPKVASTVPGHVRVLVVAVSGTIGDAYAEATQQHGPANDWESWLIRHAPHTGSALPAVSSSIVYTSGTTGRPKGVRRETTPEVAKRAAAAVARLYDFRSDAIAAVTGPMYHSALNGYGLGMAAAGADVYLMPRFDAEQLLAMIDRHRLTHLHMVPIMFVRLLRLPEETRRRYDVSSLRHVIHAAAPCPIDVKRKMIKWWGPILHEYFGSTETRMIAACDSRQWLEHPGTVGHILPHTDVMIVGEDSQPCATGTPGEIYAWNHDVEEFAYTGNSTERSAVTRDGLVTVGDVGYLDDAGFLFLCDRRRDMINSGGVNIYPVEIENCLLEA